MSGGAKLWRPDRPGGRKYGVTTVRFRENGRLGEKKQSVSLTLFAPYSLVTTQTALKVKKILPVLDVLGLLHQEALALKKRHRDPRSRATQQACCREREEVKKRGILEGEGG